jgi:hypothetical protein
MSLGDRSWLCWTVTHEETKDGEIEIGHGWRVERTSCIYVTHDAQCRFDSKTDVVTTSAFSSVVEILLSSSDDAIMVD